MPVAVKGLVKVEELTQVEGRKLTFAVRAPMTLLVGLGAAAGLLLSALGIL